MPTEADGAEGADGADGANGANGADGANGERSHLAALHGVSELARQCYATLPHGGT